jgi:glycine/D-amino acid oxidase-like deaminating enzyme
MTSTYIDTYYRRSLGSEESYAPAEGNIDTDVCIIGGGLAGLTTGLELARHGRRVTLLEGRRIGWGASGRNGGFVSPGYATDLSNIARKVGPHQAKELYRLSIEGVNIVADNIRDLSIRDAAPITGILSVIRYDDAAGLLAYRDHLAEDVGRHLRFMPTEEIRATLRSPKYHQGLFADDGFHFHPLNYCRALAREIRRLGGQVHEESTITSVDLSHGTKTAMMRQARISANEIVFAGGGYTDALCPALKRAVLPIATYVLLTEAAGDLLAETIRTKAAIGDDRRAGDYYRIIENERLLWGGRITTRTTDPNNLAALLRKEMVSTYPQLAGLKVELAWSGLMAYARHLMPQIGQLAPGAWYCTAFGGHGMNTSSIGGRLIAEAITGNSDRYRLFAPFGLVWNGGPFGVAAAQLTYWAYQFQDYLRERRAAAIG